MESLLLNTMEQPNQPKDDTKLNPIMDFSKEPILGVKQIITTVKKYTQGKVLNYINELRQETKSPTFKTNTVSQLLYILYGIKNAIKNAKEFDVYTISGLLGAFDARSIHYKVLKHVQSVVADVQYTEECTEIEETILLFILTRFKNNSASEFEEHQQQFIVEIFINYIKMFSKHVANYCWESNKPISDQLTNSIIRNLDAKSGVNPGLFKTIYTFGKFINTSTGTKKQTKQRKTSKKKKLINTA